MSIIVKNYSETKRYSLTKHLNLKVKDFKKQLANDFNLNIDEIQLEHYNRKLDDNKLLDHYILEENNKNKNFIIFINSETYDLYKINKYLLFSILFMLSTC